MIGNAFFYCALQEQINCRSRDIEDGLGECFWELISEFEGSLQSAFDRMYPDDEYDSERIDAFDVFGNFVLSIKADGVDVENITLPFDINHFVYGYISYCAPAL